MTSKTYCGGCYESLSEILEAASKTGVEHVQDEVNIHTKNEASLVANLLLVSSHQKEESDLFVKTNIKLCCPLKTKLQLNGRCLRLMAVTAAVSSV